MVAGFDFHHRAEFFGQLFGDAADIGMGLGFGGGAGFERVLAALFGFAHRPAVFDGFVGEFKLLCHGQADQCAGVSHFQKAGGEHFLHGGGQFEQAQAVGYGAAAAADGFGDGFVGEFKFVYQAAEALGFFYGIEVFALDVFYQAHRHGGFVVGLFDDGGNFVQSGELCGPPAAFACDDFIAVQPVFAHGDGLDDALGADGIGEFLKGGFVHLYACLIAAGTDLGDGYLGQAVGILCVQAA